MLRMTKTTDKTLSALIPPLFPKFVCTPSPKAPKKEALASCDSRPGAGKGGVYQIVRYLTASTQQLLRKEQTLFFEILIIKQNPHLLLQPAFSHKLIFQLLIHRDGRIQTGASYYRSIQISKTMLSQMCCYLRTKATC